MQFLHERPSSSIIENQNKCQEVVGKADRFVLEILPLDKSFHFPYYPARI